MRTNLPFDAETNAALGEHMKNKFGATKLWFSNVLVWEAPEAKPIGGLMDKRFVYVPAHRTNVAATIARVKAELENGSRKL